MFNDSCLSFLLDKIRLIFLSMVFLISRIIFLYRKFYIGEISDFLNIDNKRFSYLLFLFVMSIILLVLSNSWVIVIIGWDRLGVVSFLLVIFYNNPSRVDSGIITVLINRLGDCLFILGTILIFYLGTINIDFLWDQPFIIFCFLICMGAITKRAQVPFSSWLPAAIAAPTPVSSLVHSSTLVTAGIFLIVRFNYTLFIFFHVLIIISLLTIFIGGIGACYELDFKKVVAISTLSQLGFIVFTLSMGYWFFCLAHVIFHAFFKSRLFVRTGNLINFISGNQDSRLFGSMGSRSISKIVFLIRSMSLIGFPFSLGFYSKDLIILNFRIDYFRILTLLFYWGCCFTVAYRFRIISLSFLRFPNSKVGFIFTEHKFFLFPVIILYRVNVFLGNFFSRVYFSHSPSSFIDLAWGLSIILLGLLTYKLIPKIYLLIKLFYLIVFLSVLSSSKLSGWGSKIFSSYNHEYSWIELFSGKGIKDGFEKVNFIGVFYNFNIIILFFISLTLLLLFF